MYILHIKLLTNGKTFDILYMLGCVLHLFCSARKNCAFNIPVKMK